MATIRKHFSKDPPLSFTDRIRIEDAPPAAKKFSRPTDARQWARNTESAIREHRYYRPRESERRTVSDPIKRYRLEITHDPKKVSAGRLNGG